MYVAPSANSRTRQNVTPHASSKYYIADPLLAQAEMAELLRELTFNSKELINKITQFADANRHISEKIVGLIREHLKQVKKDLILPVLYIIDSIVKNIRAPYISLFEGALVADFLWAFDAADDEMKKKMYKMRLTWDPFYSLTKLFELDNIMQSQRDSNWPIKPLPAHLKNSLDKKLKDKLKLNQKGGGLGGGISLDANQNQINSLPPGRKPSENVRAQLEIQREKIKAEMELQKAKQEIENLKREQKRLIIQQKNQELSNLTEENSKNIAPGTKRIAWQDNTQRQEELNKLKAKETEKLEEKYKARMDHTQIPMPKINKNEAKTSDQIAEQKRKIFKTTLAANYNSGMSENNLTEIGERAPKPNQPIPKVNIRKLDQEIENSRKEAEEKNKMKDPRAKKKDPINKKDDNLPAHSRKSTLHDKHNIGRENKAKTNQSSSIKTFTIPVDAEFLAQQKKANGEIEIPEAIMNATKETLYQHARKQYKEKILNRQQYEKLIEQLKFLIDARDAQLEKMKKLQDEMVEKKGGAVGADGKVRKNVKDDKYRGGAKKDGPNPLDAVFGGEISDDEMEVDEVDLVMPGQDDPRGKKQAGLAREVKVWAVFDIVFLKRKKT